MSKNNTKKYNQEFELDLTTMQMISIIFITEEADLQIKWKYPYDKKQEDKREVLKKKWTYMSWLRLASVELDVMNNGFLKFDYNKAKLKWLIIE